MEANTKAYLLIAIGLAILFWSKLTFLFGDLYDKIKFIISNNLVLVLIIAILLILVLRKK